MPLNDQQKSFVEVYLNGSTNVFADGEPDEQMVKFTKARLMWDQARKTVQSELQDLEKNILSEVKDLPFSDEVAKNTYRLYTLLQSLDTRLIDALDDALNATNAQARQEHNDRARRLLDEYSSFVVGNALLDGIEKNPFKSIFLKPMLETTLAKLRQNLA